MADRKVDLDIANVQVLIARYGDRVPHMLSAQQPIEAQLEQLARDFGEKHITINGAPYKEFAEKYDLERRGDTELPETAGRSAVTRHDPEEKLESNREAGVHNAEDHTGTIVPTVDGSAEEDARLAEIARSKQEEDSKLSDALKRDTERKEAERADSAVKSQLTKQVSEKAGLGTGGQGSGPDMQETADRQEEKSDAELAALLSDAESRGDTDSVDEIKRYMEMTNEERAANRPIVDANGSVRVASRDPNKLANEPPAPPAKDAMRKELEQGTSGTELDADGRSKPPVDGATADPIERKDAEQMSKAQIKAELDEYGAGYETDANKRRLVEQVQEERAKRLPK